MSSSFSDFMLEMEQESRSGGPEVEATFFESQQRHWIGRLLYERRREQRLTQAKLAALSGIDQGDISKIENSEANPTLETLEVLSAALGCTLALQPVPDETRVLLQVKQEIGSRPGQRGTPTPRQPRREIALESAATGMLRAVSPRASTIKASRRAVGSARTTSARRSTSDSSKGAKGAGGLPAKQ